MDKDSPNAKHEANGVRHQILQRFESSIDDILTDEAPPAGVDPQTLPPDGGEGQGTVADRNCDLFGLWSAMTNLTQEVKLQGRTFKQLQETLLPSGDLEKKLSALTQSQLKNSSQLDQLSTQVRDLVEAGRKTRELAARDRRLIDVLLDLHGRLGRGLESCESKLKAAPRVRPPRFWDRLRGRAGLMAETAGAIEAIKDGYRLTLERLDEVLQDHHIKPIECLGKPFDPYTMEAARVEPTDAHDPGTVLEVFEPGFERDGQLLRPTKVRVAADPQDEPVEQNETESIV